MSTNASSSNKEARDVSPRGSGSGSPWIRLPKPGEHEANTGLSRSVIGRLANAGKVRSISLREPGARRGCRLISLPSLLAYLDGLAAGQEAGQ